MRLQSKKLNSQLKLIFFFYLLFMVFETRLLCVALAVLHLNVNMAGLKLKDPLASAFQEVGLKVGTTMPSLLLELLKADKWLPPLCTSYGRHWWQKNNSLKLTQNLPRIP